MDNKPLSIIKIGLARQYAKFFPKDMFIAVTGSAGKSTTTAATICVLSQKYKTISTKIEIESLLNIPETILKIRPSVKKVVLEMGCKDLKELDFNLSFTTPKSAIITRVESSHKQPNGQGDKLESKLLQVLPKNGFAILNGDDINSKKIASGTAAQVIYFGKDPQNCTVWAGNIRIENFITRFELNCGVERVQIDYPLLGEHQIYSALAAATLGIIEGLSLIQIKRGLEKMEVSEHKLQLLYGPNGSIILDDSIDASPVSVESAIDTLLQMSARRRVVVLGEMKDLAENSESLHREVARKLYKEKIDLILLGGGEAKIVADELKSLGFFEERLDWNLQNSQMVSKLLKVLQKGDVCLIKGSKVIRLDEVVKRIANKGKD